MSPFSSAAFLLLTAMCATAQPAAAPVETVWIHSLPAATASLARVSPDVHSFEVRERDVVVRSAGISLFYLGPLQNTPPTTPREMEFRIPRRPRPSAGGIHTRIPCDVAAVFANGVPFHNLFCESLEGRNLWHFDSVAANSSELPQMLRELIAGSGEHSPILGFALDGYPIYGPWGFDASGRLQRMRSSYRLRAMKQRTSWPDDTRLTPGQSGPDLGGRYPAGAFAEDYEYAARSGDLDEFNGRFAKTPEYPDGTYAYFLSVGADGRLAHPYLLGPEFYGAVEEPRSEPDVSVVLGPAGVKVRAGKLMAGRPAVMRFRVEDDRGRAIRTLEIAHEKPIHLIVVSDDLEEFDHIHPEPSGDGFEVSYTFRHGGRYRLYADHVAPGRAPRVEPVDVDISGERRARGALHASGETQVAGRDLTFTFPLGPDGGLEPYLGAWAHIVVIDEELRNFIHAHPLEDAGRAGADGAHTHAAGPAPASVSAVINFPHAGLYKLWLQTQRNGIVATEPRVIRVERGLAEEARAETPPAGAIRIAVSTDGFDPARVDVPARKRVKLAFVRDTKPNCGGKVVFPELKLSRDLPPGKMTVIEIEAPANGELKFTCGMGMYRGVVIAR